MVVSVHDSPSIHITGQLNQFQLLIWYQESQLVPNHWVPRDATECRHLPCNVSMETLRSPKNWAGVVQVIFSLDWNSIEKTYWKHQQHSIYIKFRSCTYHLFTNEDTNPVGWHGTFLTSRFVTKVLASAGPLDNQNMVGAERCLG